VRELHPRNALSSIRVIFERVRTILQQVICNRQNHDQEHFRDLVE
jgi:hypothetical protein